jgi:hypothetical protein
MARGKAGYWMLDAGCLMLDTGCWLLDHECWIFLDLTPGALLDIQYPESSIQDHVIFPMSFIKGP